MNQYSRTQKVIGINNLKKIKDTNVLIVGIGGVGGSSLEMIARSGIENITIIDYDKFEESNLNRQILSLSDNIGFSKVLIAKKRIENINSACKVTTYNRKLDKDLINELPLNFDYIIDACDDVKAKVLLVRFALENSIKIISSCGTGNRMHPEKLVITDIWKTNNDPLARKFRYELRKENINYKLPVVCSNEIPIIKMAGSVGSVATVPNAAGILLASYVINDIIK